MTILTDQGTKTHYSHDTKVTTRAIDNHIAKIALTDTLPRAYPEDCLDLLNEVANLSNEDYKALSEFQRRKDGK